MKSLLDLPPEILREIVSDILFAPLSNIGDAAALRAACPYLSDVVDQLSDERYAKANKGKESGKSWLDTYEIDPNHLPNGLSRGPVVPVTGPNRVHCLRGDCIPAEEEQRVKDNQEPDAPEVDTSQDEAPESEDEIA